MRNARKTLTTLVATAVLLLALPGAAFAADSQGRSGIDAAADAVRNALSPSLLTYENMQKAQGAVGGIDIDAARVQGLQDVMYDGNSFSPTITLKLDGKPLREGTDYTVTIEGDTVNPGFVSVTVIGCGRYTGAIETGFTIMPCDIAQATIDVIPDQKATGEEIRPVPTVELDGKTLVEGIDYTTSYADNIEKGTASLVVEGIGNCTGQQGATFEIIPNDEDEQTGTLGLAEAWPFVAGPALVAAVALAIIVTTLLRRKPSKGARRG